MVISDEPSARQYRQDLLALKQQAGGYFLPLLIALAPHAESIPWLAAGFDDVLRMPLRKAELAARLQVYLLLREQSKESRRLTRQVVLTQEAERKRLSRELHDEIGQALTAVSFNLQALHQLSGNSNVPAPLQDSLNIIEGTLQQVRDLSLDLHPAILDDLGLVAALQWYVERQAERASLTIELNADPLEVNLAEDVKTSCFRIAQEALTNILRHAKAKTVQVELHQRKAELELVIATMDLALMFRRLGSVRRAAQVWACWGCKSACYC
jgi:signal transduction histidine kinase